MRRGWPAVTDPGILDPRGISGTVLTVRFPNPFLPDSPQRIATDTSQKLSVRFGETIKAYMTSLDLDMDRLRGIPLVLAGWLRYRMAVDDDGRLMELSPDPMAERLGRRLERIQLGGCLQMEHIRGSEHVLRPEGVPGPEIREALRPVLSDAAVFGVDLFKAGLADRVTEYFTEMAAGPGMVRRTLHALGKGRSETMKPFMDEEFLLDTDAARRLYHTYAEPMPIADYHCHIDAREIFEDRRFENLTQAWLGGDHYKWRLMRAGGVPEELVTGNGGDWEKFQKWAGVLELAAGSPLYHWSHLELRRYFGYGGVLNEGQQKRSGR